MKNNKSMYILLIIMLISMVSIGYALLTGQLNINGSAKIKAASWNIYFKNIKIKEGSVTASVAPAISNKTTVNFEVNLNSPGDFYEFNVDVVNDGTVDAMIERINITPELTLEQQNYLNYSVTYLDDVEIKPNDILHSKKFRTIKVRVEYKDDELNSNDETINFRVNIEYKLANNMAEESLSHEIDIPVTLIISGDGTQVGDEIAIGDEHFYVINNDGNNITMLAKYNLLVGNQCDSSGSNCISIANPTGIQDVTAIGYDASNSRIGTVAFSSTNYWYNGSSLKSEYGTSYPSYVYDNNASIKTYVDNYKDYLESLGAEVEEVRLISYEELVSLGCNPSLTICPNAPSWVYSTSYWSGSAYNDNYLWRVDSPGDMYGSDGSYNSNRGVRPVIVIPADSI